MSDVNVPVVGTPVPQQSPTRHNVRMHGETISYLRIAGTGPVIVLLHGVGSSAETWDTSIETMACRGADVIALDLPGHGHSSSPRGDYSLGAMASTVRDLLDELDIDRCVLVGHSLGGGIALQFVYQFPERVERLVLVSSGGLGSETFPLLRAATLPGAELVLPVLTHHRTTAAVEWVAAKLHELRITGAALPSDALTTLREIANPDKRTAFLATLRSVVDISGQRVSALAKLPAAAHVPTLLIWGDRDRVIPAKHGKEAHDLLPKSRLVIFRGAGHEPHRYDPERLAQLIADFAAGASD